MKFTIRDLLWLLLTAALGLGWAMYARRMEAENNRLLLRTHDQKNDLEYVEHWLLDTKTDDACDHLRKWATQMREAGLSINR